MGIYERTLVLRTSKIENLSISELKKFQGRHKNKINQRLSEFKAVPDLGDKRVFYELCYCILTPQSSGLACDGIIADLVIKGILDNPRDRLGELEKILKRTRFWKTKSRNLIRAWDKYMDEGSYNILKIIIDKKRELENCCDLRNWFRRDLRGFGIGMKESSHFLRNIGFLSDIAIIDRHILRSMKELQIIEDPSSTLKNESDYLKLESKINDFAMSEGIAIEELDLLLWSAKTGYIFK